MAPAVVNSGQEEEVALDAVHKRELNAKVTCTVNLDPICQLEPAGDLMVAGRSASSA